jgi:tetratricopeptide (TPR) repeat protein
VKGTSVDARLAISFICRLRGEYDRAFQWLDGALDLLVEMGRDVRQDLWALYYIRKADVLSERGQGEEALGLYTLALDLCARIGDLTGESMVLNNMHGSYSGTGDYERAMDTLERVVDLTRRLDDRLGLAIAYYNIAEHLLELNALASAKVYYGRYMEMSLEIGNVLGLGFGHFGLGFLNQLEGDMPEAEACYKRALDVFEELECAEPMAGCRLRLASVLVDSGHLGEAWKQLEKLSGYQHPPSTESEILFVQGLLMMNEPGAGPATMKGAAGFIRESMGGLEQGHSAPEAALRYTTLAHALTLGGETGKAREALIEGSERIAGELGQVVSAAARNGIMGRTEIRAFLGLLAREGLDFPPSGLEFPTD